ncbi:hypothetical protein NAL32_16770 [Chryseobacterium sp. Ch-15]|uniref:Uncharacterized protein n=1 Tax=Chryseobacterium muglaense TaxID=2893752 RepID=A0A9Q3USC0_9FLAO|nr:hypothetical protein [Chryseobacterium muglaense]MBD3906340.1 hypothetical protein [Chryseobacterium muglaense]MCC9033108.1 hypothetical protein [Chryseobacterium muglaense]MCM2556039.1 hypothetical protein [Chryseobacterium muglaense]
MKSITEIEIILNVNDQVKNVNSSRALLKKKRDEFDNVLKFWAKLISSLTNRNWQYHVCHFSYLEGHMTALGSKIQ